MGNGTVGAGKGSIREKNIIKRMKKKELERRKKKAQSKKDKLYKEAKNQKRQRESKSKPVKKEEKGILSSFLGFGDALKAKGKAREEAAKKKLRGN